ncbi:MAG: hypothetical protein ACI4V5_01965, partial [Prevotella sp.]
HLYMIISGMSASGKGEVGLAQKIIVAIRNNHSNHIQTAYSHCTNTILNLHFIVFQSFLWVK